MTETGYLRGHAIERRGRHWVYTDTGERCADTWRDRPCGHCGRPNTPEGHDGCLGTLPGVMNACCGHGHPDEAYVQYPDGRITRGEGAVREMRELAARRGIPEPEET